MVIVCSLGTENSSRPSSGRRRSSSVNSFPQEGQRSSRSERHRPRQFRHRQISTTPSKGVL